MTHPSLPSCTPVWRTALVVGAVALAGCSSKPPTPEWQMNAYGAAQKAVAATLSGDTRVERLEWDRARSEVAQTGRPDVLARLELMRCAVLTASLDLSPCSAFDTLRADAQPEEVAYADYLAGRVQPTQIPLLPTAQRAVAAAVVTARGAVPLVSTGALSRTPSAPANPAPMHAAGSEVQAVTGVEDPLSRLVGAGVLLRAGRAGPEVVSLAVDAASAQGWRRPLLAWLLVQLQRAELSKDWQEAATVRRRIAIVEQAGKLAK